MKYNNSAKLLAEESWRMLTDECKEKMASIKESYIESLTEDIKHFTDKIKKDYAKEALRVFIQSERLRYKQKEGMLSVDELMNDIDSILTVK